MDAEYSIDCVVCGTTITFATKNEFDSFIIRIPICPDTYDIPIELVPVSQED